MSVDFSLKETSPNLGGGRVSGNNRLTSSFDLVEQLHFLFVRIDRVRFLPPCDPFVEVKIGNYKASTFHFDSKWGGEVFAFTKDRIQDGAVNIAVKDKATSAAIGTISFPISDIPSRVPPDSPLVSQWYLLDDQTGKKGERIELMMSVWFGTQADEVYHDAWFADAAAVRGENISDTRSKVYESPKLNYLRINVIQAQDLVIRNKNRKPKVFVKARLGELVLKTKVSKDKSLNPKWNEDIMFVAGEPFEHPLIITVEDKISSTVEECLGKLELPLSGIAKRDLPAAASAKWYNLQEIMRPDDGQALKEVKFASKLNMRVSLDRAYHVMDEPVSYSSDFRATVKNLWGSPIGVLELGILSAKELVPNKKKEKPTVSAYSVAKYGTRWVRTRTIVDNVAPKWNEQYTFPVYDIYTVISIAVFDNSHLEGGGKGTDQRMGKVRIRVSTLQADRIYTHSYPLIVLTPDGVKKMGELQLAVRFTCSSYANLLWSYTKPLFPKMHYTHPLSVIQIESLRNQACKMLVLRLARADTPLRKEVVEYMLDVSSNLWSIRKGRANFERILATLDGFGAAWKWFDQICKWKNTTTTVLAHLIFLIFVINPRVTFATIFFYGFFLGLWNFRKRPRHPPHMDTKLSLAEAANPDELDEEFDTFPSSQQGPILRMRYDRLRTIAGRMMSILGDIATQLERFRLVLTWRDPRATFLFVFFCLFAGIVIYMTPFKLLIVSGGFYAMRHPRFRVALPSIPNNFFRRLPTRLDSML